MSHKTKTMIKKIILALAFFQVNAFMYAQTDVQKELIFERINRDSKGSSILPKIQPIENKEELFKNAQVFPIFKVEFDKDNKAKLVQNKEYFLVFYVGRLYCFMNNIDSRFFENSPVIQNIIEFNKDKKEFFIVYFSDTFSLYGKYLNPLITDRNVSYIIDKEEKKETSDYINFKYGSLEKYKERSSVDLKRDNLHLENLNNYIKTIIKLSNIIVQKIHC